MTSNELRQAFLDYFVSHEHLVVPSSSLVPQDDPTLLFTNAGMVQFKNYFLGRETPPRTRATSSQRCVRAGGKHNDLENVGYTARHHTFFEMLGNFSFGDYFKAEAIRFAWDFLTRVLGLPKEKLWVTVYKDDKESEAIWLNEIGIDPKRFSRCGEKDNFWSMGDTGPCGPCTEIFFDHGPEVPGGPPGSPDEDGDRYIEIWNVVFMQFNRDAQGEMTLLPKPCVDTGMGLERISAVLQGVHSNYDIDLFQHLLKALAEICPDNEAAVSSRQAVVDHIRSAAFLILDGVLPSNEGRGYVLRRIIRRAIRHGYKLGISETFFFKLVQPLVEIMGGAYPELVKQQARLEETLQQEERQFAETLRKGLKILEHEIQQLGDDTTLPGQVVFQLYDTYGFPKDLTADIARERGLLIDEQGFDLAMAKQRQQSQQASQFSVDYTEELHLKDKTAFIGYESLTGVSLVTSLLSEQRPVAQLSAGERGAVVLQATPFYAESGGQVGDSGELVFAEGRFVVADTKKHGDAFLHIGHVSAGVLHAGDEVQAKVSERRQAIRLNHSATHLLHAALRDILGEHVMQKGSLVDAERLRFDFTHSKALTQKEWLAVERLVNQKIRENLVAEVASMSLAEAKAKGAMALFGEKYGDEVRVIRFGDFSIELCGGTHVERTGDIGFFKLVSEAATSAGVRRIEAVTGAAAELWVEKLSQQMRVAANELRTGADGMVERLLQVLTERQQLEKELQQMKQRLAEQKGGDLLADVITINGVSVLAAVLPGADRMTLRSSLDRLKQSLDRYAIVLAAVEDGKISLVAGVDKSCHAYFKAGDLLNQVARQVGGKGGGRPDLAQGGGDQPEHLDVALRSVPEWVDQKIPVQTTRD